MNDPRELLSRLAAPFAAEDLEWRLQIAYEDRMQGIAVPYVTNRAIQNRLDDVMGPDRWHNEFKPWHSTGKRESQLCGISLYFEERGWITKWDGAEDSDIEPIGRIIRFHEARRQPVGHRSCSLQYGHRLGQRGEEGQELHHQAHRAR